MKLTNPDDWKEVFRPDNDYTFGPEQDIEDDTDKINAKLKMFIGITQSSDWIGFVEELLNYCPFVRDRGRPSAENVKNSIPILVIKVAIIITFLIPNLSTQIPAGNWAIT